MCPSTSLTRPGWFTFSTSTFSVLLVAVFSSTAWRTLSPNCTTQDRAKDLGHAEWLALLLDREAASRNTKRAQSRLRAARLRDRRVGARTDLERASARGLKTLCPVCLGKAQDADAGPEALLGMR